MTGGCRDYGCEEGGGCGYVKLETWECCFYVTGVSIFGCNVMDQATGLSGLPWNRFPNDLT